MVESTDKTKQNEVTLVCNRCKRTLKLDKSSLKNFPKVISCSCNGQFVKAEGK